MKLTKLQGQYAALISSYRKLNRRPPAEREIGRYFGTTPPAVHDMILRLEKRGAISGEPGTARSIRVLLLAEEIPPLVWMDA